MLRAPSDGVVTVIVAEVGEAVRAGQPMLTIDDPRKRWLSFNVREDALRGLTIGAQVQVTPATPGEGPGAVKPPPGLSVEFASSQDMAALTRSYVFGYPAEPPYTGLYPAFCAGRVTASGDQVEMPCGMTAGDSGGPWLAGFRPRPGSGQVTAVTTYKLSGDLAVLYGAVLGPQARALYQRALRPAR